MRKSAGAADCFDGLAQVVGERVGGGDDIAARPGSGRSDSGGQSWRTCGLAVTDAAADRCCWATQAVEALTAMQALATRSACTAPPPWPGAARPPPAPGR